MRIRAPNTVYERVRIRAIWSVYEQVYVCVYVIKSAYTNMCVYANIRTYTNNEILRMRAPYWFVYVHFMFLYDARIRSNMCVYEHNVSSYTNFVKVRIRTIPRTYTC